MKKSFLFVLLIVFFISIDSFAQKDLDARLIGAVKSGNKSEITKLIEQGANVNATDKNGGTVFMWALFKCDLETVKYLVEMKADYNKNGFILIEEINNIKYYYGTPLAVAAGEGNLEVLKYLVEELKLNVNEKDNYEKKFSPLQIPVIYEDFEVIKYLVDNGADVNTKDADGNTPFMLKLIHPRKSVKMLKFLYLLGADLKVVNNIGQSAFDLADEYIVQEATPFLKSPVVNIFDVYSFGFDDLVIKKIRDNNEQIFARNSAGESLLHLSVSDSRDSLTQFLLKENSLINSADNNNCTPLFNAVNSGRINIAKQLIDLGGDVNFPNNENITPYRVIKNRNYSELSDFLLQKGIKGNDDILLTPELVIQKGHHETVRFVEFSPDGKYLASGGFDRYIKLWDLATGVEMKTFVNNDYVESVSFSPDGNYLASASRDNVINVWDVFTGKIIKKFKGHTNLLNSVCFSPDGKFIVSRGLDYSVRIWDFESNFLVKNFYDSTNSVSSISFSPDGKYFACGSGRNNVKIWDLENKKEFAVLSGLDGFVYTVSFSPDGKKLVNRTVNGTITVWDLSAFSKIKEIKGEYFEGSVIYSTDGNYLFAGCGQVVMLDAVTLKEIKVMGYADNRSRLSVSNDGNYVASGTDKGIIIWNAISGQQVMEFKGRTQFITDLSVSRNGKYIMNKFGTHDFQLWNLEYGKIIRQSKKMRNVSSIAFSEDNLLAGLFSYGKINIIEPSTGNDILEIPTGNYNLDLLAFSYDGSYLAGVSGYEKTVIVWDLNSGKEVKQFKSHKNEIELAFFIPDSRYFVTCERYGDIIIWDFDSGKEIKTFRENENVKGYNLDEDGKVKADVMQGKILVYRAETGKIINSSIEYNKYKGGTTVSSFGKYFFTSIYEGCVIYDLKLQKEVMRIEGEPLLFSPDEKYFISSSFSDIKIWDVEKRSLYKILNGHSAEVRTAAFSPDGKYLLSGSEDGSLKIWDWINGKVIVTIVPIDDGDDFIFVTPDKYYLTTKEGFKAVAFRIGNHAYPPEQYDLKFNRPDIVLERIGYAPEELIKSLRKSYERRLKKMNFDENMFNPDFHLPEIKITSSGLPITTLEKNLVLNISASDSKYNLDRLNVYINNVPIYGIGGIDLRGKNSNYFESELNLELQNEKNKIQVSVLNEKGVESLKETFEINYEGKTNKQDLFLVGVGVSKYQNEKYNLNYAEKDVNDVTEFISGQKDKFNEVKVMKVLNSDATRENILKIKDFLMQSKPDDEVIVFFAGHGLLDKDYNFYFGTQNIDFENPSVKGVSYQDIENLLDGIPSRKKVLLIDACHSGEVDKEDVKEIKNIKTETGEVTFRGFTELESKKESFGMKNTSQLLQEMFVDLRRSSGAMVISSAGGFEFAYEGGGYKNGLFTYCLLDGLKTKKADANKDKKITVKELLEYVSEQVSILTKGKQVPTSRRENTDFNFVLW